MAPNKLRPGVESAVELWKSSDTAKWEELYCSYEDSREITQRLLKNSQVKLSKHSFIEDDKWKEENLPKHISSKKSITLSQLERLMVWKMRRGQFRPTLMGLIRRNNPSCVEKTTCQAIALVEKSVENIPEAFKVIEGLYGVGPATASLILSVVLPDHVPFMSDEAMDASIGLPRSYTSSRYAQYQKALSAKAEELGVKWNVQLVEKVLYTAAILRRNEV
ncbi:hypothetical protein ACHWQZ_G018541 [Mnemiopsis leidyi]